MKPNCVDIEMDADRFTFGSDNAAFSESICKKVGSENMPLDNLQPTLCFTDAQINQVEELKEIAQIELALRNPTI